MSVRLQNRRRVQDAAHAAVAADQWLTRHSRQQALAVMVSEPAIQPLLHDLAANPRVVRRLPNRIAALLDVFTDHPELAPWLTTEQDFFAWCRMTGAVLYGRQLARLVDGGDVAALVDDLGHDAWRVGLEHAFVTGPDDTASPTPHFPDRRALTDALLAAGLRAVYRHLQTTTPDHLADIGAALNLDWAEVDDGGDADLDHEAVQRVLARLRTT
jgi:hypothetical protein